MNIGQQFLEDFFSHENLLNDHLFKESHARLTTVPIISDVFCDFV